MNKKLVSGKIQPKTVTLLNHFRESKLLKKMTKTRKVGRKKSNKKKPMLNWLWRNIYSLIKRSLISLMIKNVLLPLKIKKNEIETNKLQIF